MYDGLDRVPIRNMSFKQLRERVQILQDRYDVLIRRFPQLSDNGTGAGGETVDWANIVTPLIRAQVNRLQFKASMSSEQTTVITGRPKDGRAPNESGEEITLSHTTIYKYVYEDGEGEKAELWYWNGNEWKSASGGFSSEFNQTPAGFQLSGTLELETDTDGRVTVTDSFIKMYPEKKVKDEQGNIIATEPTYDPKLQIGYDGDSEDSNPIFIFGVGSGEKYPDDARDQSGNPAPWAGQPKVNEAIGYPLRYGQAAVYKTVAGLIMGAVSGNGFARWVELRSPSGEAGTQAGVYYCHEESTGGFDERGDPTKETVEEKII